MNSYSHNQKTKKNQKSKTRRTKTIENITSFSMHNDIICTQESHTPDKSPFYNLLPKNLLRYANPSTDPALAGTDIFCP
jgi:hypothetical protein